MSTALQYPTGWSWLPAPRYRSEYDGVRKTVADARRKAWMPRWFFLLFLHLKYLVCWFRTSDKHPREDDHFSVLPAELLAEILGYLPPREVAAAQTICRSLCDTVRGSLSLKYSIEYHLAEVVEGPLVRSMVSSAERFDQLNEWKNSRRDIHWQKMFQVEQDDEREDDRTRWRIHGRALHGVNRKSRTMHFRTISSKFADTLDEARTVPWPFFVPFVGKYWYDSYQDLLIIQSFVGHGGFRYYFLTLTCASTGEPFDGWTDDQSIVPLIHHDGGRIFSPRRTGLNILGHLYVLYRDFGPEHQDVIVTDWRQGRPLLTISSDDRPFLEVATFLDDDHLVGVTLASASTPASVVIIPWRKLPSGKVSFSEALRFATRLHLPEPRQGLMYRHEYFAFSGVEIHCAHEARPQDEVSAEKAFVPAEAQLPLVLLYFRIAPQRDVDDVDDENHHADEDARIQFVIPGRVLLARSKDAPDAEIDAGGARHAIAWRDWGHDTRVWNRFDHDRRLVCVYGSRLLCIESLDYPNKKLVVYDFASAESMMRDAASGDDALLDEIVVQPSYLRKNDQAFFREAVVTRAPYRRLESTLDVNCWSWDDLYFGENCFVREHERNSRSWVAYSI